MCALGERFRPIFYYSFFFSLVATRAHFLCPSNLLFMLFLCARAHTHARFKLAFTGETHLSNNHKSLALLWV